MKGDRNRQKSTFSTNNQPLRPNLETTEARSCDIPPRIIRADQDLHDFIAENISNDHPSELPVTSLSTDGTIIDLTALRPKPSPSKLDRMIDSQRTDLDTYVILHRGKLQDFMNEVFSQHVQSVKRCNGQLIFDESSCQQWGLAWIMAVKCTQCSFESSNYKLYTELQTESSGRRQATVTSGFQIGLSKQGIGNAGLREILLAANINPPSQSTLQRTANKVNDAVKEVNISDMHDILEDIKIKNCALGNSSGHPIPAEADATYNNRLFSGSTPFQAGTQATFLVAEGLTKSKKIISAKTYSKLCSCLLTEKNPNHAIDCTANLDYNKSIGHEGVYLRDSIHDINKSGVQVGNLTLDGDSSSRATALDIKQLTDITINPLYCTKHLTRLMQKHIRKMQFSKVMFKGINKVSKDKAHTRFSHDISSRVSAEFNALHKSTNGSFETMSEKLPGIIDAIIDCYRGNCLRCCENSYICKEKNPWTRPFIDTDPLFRGRREFITPTSDDITKLRKLIEMRLGPAALKKTVTNTTQNKCEAANRGVKKSAPSALTFRRNYSGRVHSAVHSMNNGPGQSTAILCGQIGCPVSAKSNVMLNLKRLDHRKAYYQKRQQSAAYKLARRSARMNRYKAYDEMKKEKEPNQYERGRAALDDVLPPLFIPPTSLPQHLDDHNYMTRKITVTGKLKQ